VDAPAESAPLSSGNLKLGFSLTFRLGQPLNDCGALVVLMVLWRNTKLTIERRCPAQSSWRMAEGGPANRRHAKLTFVVER